MHKLYSSSFHHEWSWHSFIVLHFSIFADSSFFFLSISLRICVQTTFRKLLQISVSLQKIQSHSFFFYFFLFSLPQTLLSYWYCSFLFFPHVQRFCGQLSSIICLSQQPKAAPISDLWLVLNISDSSYEVKALEIIALCWWSPGPEVYTAKAKGKRAEGTSKPLKSRSYNEDGHGSTGSIFEVAASCCLALEAATYCSSCTQWCECQVARARFIRTGIISLGKKRTQAVFQAHAPYFESEGNEAEAENFIFLDHQDYNTTTVAVLSVN